MDLLNVRLLLHRLMASFPITPGQKDGQILTRSDHIVLSLMVLYYLQTIKN